MAENVDIGGNESSESSLFQEGVPEETVVPKISTPAASCSIVTTVVEVSELGKTRRTKSASCSFVTFTVEHS